MPVGKVLVSADVYMVCMTHALTTEVEEIMGLLIGYCKDNICYVVSLAVLERLDKRKDRVEIAPEKMAEGVEIAENLTKSEPTASGDTLIVVGWYHSHPHITVYPSEVDVRTQHSYQQMSDSFIGLIFGVYDMDEPSCVASNKLICFQSQPKSSGAGLEYLTIPVQVVPKEAGLPVISRSCLDNWTKIVRIIMDEERTSYDAHTGPHTDAMSRFHNGCILEKNGARLVEIGGLPLVEAVQNWGDKLEHRIAELKT